MAQDTKVQRTAANTRVKHQIHWEMAKCSGMGDTVFFDPSDADEQKTHAICTGGCPIITECFIYGMTQTFGTWGGVTDHARRTLKVEKQFITCTQCGHHAIVMQCATFEAEICCHCGVWWS